MMRKQLLSIAVILALSVSCAKESVQSGSADSVSQGTGTDTPVRQDNDGLSVYLPGVVSIQFDENLTEQIEKEGSAAVTRLFPSMSVGTVERVFPYAGEFEERTRRDGLHRFYYVEFDKAIPVEKARLLFESAEGVQTVDALPKVAMNVTVNDTYFSDLWGLNGNYGINVQNAWEYSMGDENVIVCIVDQGVQLNHPDLAANCCDDNYNFVSKNTTIVAGDHGTHVAGTISGVTNNGVGVSGIAGGNSAKGQKGVTIKSAQVFQGNSSGGFANAIKWGADHGAVISQNSWGNNYDWNNNGKLDDNEYAYAMADKIDNTTKAAVDYFIKNAGCDNDGNQLESSPMKGGVVVFAAGNDGIANGAPANYEPVIAVGATTSAGKLADYSNYGSWVDICAPGSSIKSCLSSSKYGNLSGTSMACPHVSGSCALLVSKFGKQGFTNEDLKEILLAGAKSNFISYLGHNAGPFLDLEASMIYGEKKYRRADNKNPEIAPSREGDMTFRQWQTVKVPFRITDPDGDKVEVVATLEGRGSFVQDENDPQVWNFEMICELVSDFTAKKAKIEVTDNYGGYAVYEFNYTVIKNNPPQVTRTMPDLIFVGADAAEKTIDITDLFMDVDEEPLTYSVKSSSADVCAASLVEAANKLELKLKPKAFGTTKITLYAVDRIKSKGVADFSILVRQNDVKIDFYPNPVSKFLYVRTGVDKVSAQVTISNTAGAKVLDETVEASAFNPAKLDVSSLAPGSYQLKVVAGNDELNSIVVKL